MKVVFLDVDGVLNSDDWAWDLFNKYGVQVYRENILYEPALLQLRRIINETDAKIVISSSWRKIPSAYNDLKMWLNKYGMAIYDKTPYVGKTRGHDISAWLKKHSGIDEYVILDDDSDMDDQFDHFVMTNYFVGLTKENADECIKRLNGGNENG